jgi:hypothetical protein
MSGPDVDLSALLPDDATLKARRAALVDIAREAERAAGPPAWRRRVPRLVLGAAFAAASLAAVLVFNAGGDNTSRAFAVEHQEGGGVTIKIYSLEDASGLEGALEEAGIPAQVTWLPAGTICREPHYKSSTVHLPGGGTIGGMTMGGPEPPTFAVGSSQSWRERLGKYRRGEISAEEMRSSVPNLTLDPEAFRSSQSVVLSGAPAPYGGDPEGGSVTKLGIAEGPVEPCEPVPAPPSGNDPFGQPSAGGGPDYLPLGDQTLRQSAIAADLHQAAIAAEASLTRGEELPGPDQFFYTKAKVVQLQGWEPDGPGGGPNTKPRYFTANLLGPEGNALPALVPTLKEVWTAPDGKTREREVLGRIKFLSHADQRRWEAAGSPPPFAYDPSEHDVRRDRSGRPVKEFASRAFRGRREFDYLGKLSQLPSEPEALRLAIENRRGGSAPVSPSPAGSRRGGATVETLLKLLSEPIASSALRAAAFDALAEIPGIGFERDVPDVAGRRGDAISWVRERGFGSRFIFDPRTSKVLAEAEMIFGPSSTEEYGVPAGTVFRETAYLDSDVVDSIRETQGGAR